MPVKEKKGKAQILAAATSGGKGKKKKWSKGKHQEKLNNKVFIDEATYTKLENDVKKMQLITPHIISNKYHLCLSTAVNIIKHMGNTHLIKPVGAQSRNKMVYTLIK